MYDERLLERNLHPENRGSLKGATYEKMLVNDSCGDEIKVFLRVVDGVVEDGAWEGRACAIAQASADFFIERARGKKVSELAKMDWREVEELAGVQKMPARIKCAELAWKARAFDNA